MFVRQGIFDAEVLMPLAGAVNGNLRLFCLARTRRRDDLVNGSGHGGAWLFWDARRIQIELHDSCRPGHARLLHFLLDAGTRRVGGFLFAFLMEHKATMTSRWRRCSPISHSFRAYGRIL